MSKTIKGSKGPGYEYWGRRSWGGGKYLADPGRYTKKQTARKERRQSKESVKKGSN